MRERVVELREVFCVHRTDEGDAAALQGISLELGRGEIVCVLGPSGAGKSTLLRVIAGIELPSAGIVNVLGRDVGRLPARARARLRHDRLGFLGQHSESVLSPDLPGREAASLPLALRGVPAGTRRGRVRELLDAAGLRDRAGARPAELSGGERQRFALCAALAHGPSLLLADEPTGELDDASAAAIRALIAELARRSNASVIVVSHDPAMAEIADRTLDIRDGRVVQDRRGRDTALVIGRGGWMQLPSELLAGAGIGRRARARLHPDGVILTPAASASEGPPGVSTGARQDKGWRPAQVELRSVTRGYGRGTSQRLVIDSMSHAFAPGRLTVVTGRSGTGKTTLLRLLAGLDRPDAGELTVDTLPLAELDGEDLATLRRARFGYLPQEPSPVGFLSAQENVVLALRVRGWERGAAAERATAVLARVGLADRAGQRVQRLSAGETQRVALARALASARGLLIVDEPTSRLDQTSAADVAELLAAAAAQDGQTVVCATHDPAVIRQADQVLSLGDRGHGGAASRWR